MGGRVAMTSLPATLTLREAPAVLETLRGAFAAESGEVWRIDAAPVAHLDTSALAVLIECARMAAEGRRRLAIDGVPPRLADLARLYGVDGVLGIEAEPAAAAG
jgi:phospholipid transport system transporter-binding protein